MRRSALGHSAVGRARYAKSMLLAGAALLLGALPLVATASPTPPPNCLILLPSGMATLQTQNLASNCTDNWQCAQIDDGDTSYVYSADTTALGPRTDLYALDNPGARS